MKIIDCEQGTEEWHAARAGRVTGSRVAAVMAKGAGADTYAGELVAERLSGAALAEGFTSKEMQWGKDNEQLAVDTYSFMHDVEPIKVGFVIHPKIEMAGVSPDRLIGEDGLIEIKCPLTKTHIDTLRGKAIKKDYLLQMQFQMACTGRQWCDFVSFDPRLPAEMQMAKIRVKRDPIKIAEMDKAVIDFLANVDSIVADLTRRFMPQAAE